MKQFCKSLSEMETVYRQHTLRKVD
jgi:hypothetical protein